MPCHMPKETWKCIILCYITFILILSHQGKRLYRKYIYMWYIYATRFCIYRRTSTFPNFGSFCIILLSLSDCNGTRTHNHLVRKRTLWLVWINGCVFVYELSGYGFESCCSHLNFRYRACFEEGIPWHSGNFRVWIHSETWTWHDKNIQFIKLGWW